MKRIIRGSSTRRSIEEKLQDAKDNLRKQKNSAAYSKYGMDAKKLYKALSQKRPIKGKKGLNRTKTPVKDPEPTTSEILASIIPANIPFNKERVPEWFESTGKVDISIIIPLHKSRAEVVDLIKSWDLNDDGLTKEIIYVSDQCPQNSEDVVVNTWESRRRELGDRRVGRIILTKANVGFAGACNLGAEEAKGEYLIFLNADTMVTRNWVKPLYDTLRSDPKIGIVGNLQLKLNGDIDSCGSEWNATNGVFDHIGQCTYKGKRLRTSFNLSNLPSDLKIASEREMVTGCCFVVPKAIFDSVGGFDRRYHIGYWEDADLNMRVKSLGYKIYFQPDSKIYHKGGHSGARMHSLVARNRDLFHNTWVKTNLLELVHQAPKRERKPLPQQDIVVYTAITDGYDTLKESQNIKGANFVAFLDYPAESGMWQIRTCHNAFEDPNRNAKIHKVMPHLYFPEVKYSLWIDGNIELIAPVQELIHTYLGDADIAVFKHPDRRCIYEEADVCVSRKLDNPQVILDQMQRYKNDKYPAKAGLVEATVILRKHNDKVKRFNELWWEEIKEGSRRDQLSFPYVARKLGLKYNYFPGNLRTDHFILIKDGSHKKHRRKQK